MEDVDGVEVRWLLGLGLWVEVLRAMRAMLWDVGAGDGEKGGREGEGRGGLVNGWSFA